jgi:hypothetical protein
MEMFERRLLVGKTDGYELDLVNWLDGETLSSVDVTNTDGLLTVNTSVISDTSIKAILLGVSEGIAEVEFTYSTATRNSCHKSNVIVVNC